MSRAKQTRDKYKANRERVLYLLRWNAEQYGRYQMEQGLAYLTDYLGYDETTVMVMERSKVFWSWWINQWNIRDAQIFLPACSRLPLTMLEKVYTDVHSIRFLRVHPSRSVLQESYNAYKVEPDKEEMA